MRIEILQVKVIVESEIGMSKEISGKILIPSKLEKKLISMVKTDRVQKCKILTTEIKNIKMNRGGAYIINNIDIKNSAKNPTEHFVLIADNLRKTNELSNNSRISIKMEEKCHKKEKNKENIIKKRYTKQNSSLQRISSRMTDMVTINQIYNSEIKEIGLIVSKSVSKEDLQVKYEKIEILKIF